MSISRHSASHHYNKMMSQKADASSNGNHSSFFSTEPRRSSSRPTKPINGFLRNGGSNNHQQYEKISSTSNSVSINSVNCVDHVISYNYHTNIRNNQNCLFYILSTFEFKRSSESSTVVSKRNSIDAYCNINGRATSENGGISLMHHPRSLSPLPHQRSQVLFLFSISELILLL